jgi:hypothetical protein
MKKTFKFLAFAVVASLLSFTSCKDDPEGTEGGGQEQTSGVTFNFDGAVDWIPQSMHMGYEADEDEIFFMAVGTKEATTRQQAAEIIDNLDIDGDGIPTDALILGFYGTEGVQAMEGSIFDEEGDLAVMLFTGTETIEGEVYPNGWVSTNMTVTITELDMVNKKISATITAKMGWIIDLIGIPVLPEDQAEKTFTININNYDIFDLEDYYAEKLAKKLKK